MKKNKLLILYFLFIIIILSFLYCSGNDFSIFDALSNEDDNLNNGACFDLETENTKVPDNVLSFKTNGVLVSFTNKYANKWWNSYHNEQFTSLSIIGIDGTNLWSSNTSFQIYRRLCYKGTFYYPKNEIGIKFSPNGYLGNIDYRLSPEKEFTLIIDNIGNVGQSINGSFYGYLKFNNKYIYVSEGKISVLRKENKSAYD